VKYFVAIFLIILTFELSSQCKMNKPLSIDFDLISISKCNDNNDFYIERNQTTYSNMIGQIIIKNQTDSILTFWIMTCSWTDLFTIEPDSIILTVKECEKNHPTKISLQKGQSIIFNSIIEIPSDYFEKSLDKIYQTTGNLENKILYNTFKIGFILIKESDKMLAPNWKEWLYTKSRKEDYIWSEPIKIRYSNYRWNIEK